MDRLALGCSDSLAPSYRPAFADAGAGCPGLVDIPNRSGSASLRVEIPDCFLGLCVPDWLAGAAPTNIRPDRRHMDPDSGLARSHEIALRAIFVAMVKNDDGCPVTEIEASEFKAKCLKLLDDVAATREPIVVTKNGVPVAKLVPYQMPVKSIVGMCSSTIRRTNSGHPPIEGLLDRSVGAKTQDQGINSLTTSTTQSALLVCSPQHPCAASFGPTDRRVSPVAFPFVSDRPVEVRNRPDTRPSTCTQACTRVTSMRSHSEGITGMSTCLAALSRLTATLLFLGVVLIPFSVRATDPSLCRKVADGSARVIDFPAEMRNDKRVTLKGILHGPAGGGPFAAIVILPGLGGPVPPRCYGGVAELFARLGLVTLIVVPSPAVDDGGTELFQYSFEDLGVYSYGAAKALAKMPTVDPSKIGLWGHSRGGGAVMDAAMYPGSRVLPFSAAVAAAPVCPPRKRPSTIPLLLIVGTEDREIDVTACVAYADAADGATDLEFVLLEGAGHAFWAPQGATETAAADLADKALRSFWTKHALLPAQ